MVAKRTGMTDGADETGAPTKAPVRTTAKRSKSVKASAERPLETRPAETARVLQAADAAVAAADLRSAVMPAARVFEVGAESARDAYARAQAASEEIRMRVATTASAAGRGAVELNGKVLDAWRAQGDIAFDLWREAMQAGSLADAVRVHTIGMRRAYESATTHWREVAETTARLMGPAAPFGPSGDAR